MKDEKKRNEKALLISGVLSAVKKLKRVRNQIVLFDMRQHLKPVDKSIADLTKLRRELERNE